MIKTAAFPRLFRRALFTRRCSGNVVRGNKWIAVATALLRRVDAFKSKAVRPELIQMLVLEVALEAGDGDGGPLDVGHHEHLMTRQGKRSVPMITQLKTIM